MVAVGHSFLAIKFSGVDKLWITSIWSIGSADAFIARLVLFVASGHAAVIIFFILSGVVLGLSLDHDRSGAFKRYLKFLVKRIFRIYPAHIFVLSVSVMICVSFSVVNPGTLPNTTTWFNWYYRKLPDINAVIKNLLLLDVYLNPIIWTLKVEMAVAFFLPALHFISRLKQRWALLQLVVLAVLIAVAVKKTDSFFLPYLYTFYLGLLIPLYSEKIVGYFNGKTIFLYLVFAVSAFFTLLPQFLFSGKLLKDIAMSMGAASMVAIIMRHPDHYFLRNRFVKKLGQYSYSFYLWHFFVLWFLYYLLYESVYLTSLIETMSFGVAVIVGISSVIFAYFLASFSYRLIEKPGISLGRKLIHKL